jgi:2-(1,2-epoxy-1,2-dihydrophenyl)acetyl-CoA isomerase
MSEMSERRALETGTEDLLGWVEDGVAVLSFNRPASRNALSDAMYAGFAMALPVVATDPTIGCLVITGEGGAFNAGGDVKGFAEGHKRDGGGGAPRQSPAVAIDNLRQLHAQTTLAIHRLPKITVAALPGAAAGAGLSFALACDFRVATEKAVIVTAFSKIGASGDFGGSYFLTQLVGPSKAKELYVLSERLTAREAAAMGIVNRVFADTDFDQDWRAFARRIAAGPTLANRAIKENINRALIADLATCLDAEATNMITTMLSEDHRSAVAAFVAKTDPTFVGR